jgi:tryptophan-rich sensory protein
MRVLLKVLAGLLLVLGTGMALGNLWFIAVMTNLVARPSFRPPSHVPAFVMVAVGGTLCALGGCVAYRAWTHLRRPDAGTAREVISFGIYLAIFSGVTPFLWRHPYLMMLTVIGLGLLKYYLTKRIAVQPAGAL